MCRAIIEFLGAKFGLTPIEDHGCYVNSPVGWYVIIHELCLEPYNFIAFLFLGVRLKIMQITLKFRTFSE